MNRCVNILRLVNNQRVIAAHFKGEDFLRLPGQLTMQLETGRGAAGEQETVDIRLPAQRLAGLPAALQ